MSEPAPPDPVVEAYEVGVDRTLIRERLARTPAVSRTSSRWRGSPRSFAEPALPLGGRVTDFAGLIARSPMAVADRGRDREVEAAHEGHSTSRSKMRTACACGRPRDFEAIAELEAIDDELDR